MGQRLVEPRHFVRRRSLLWGIHPRGTVRAGERIIHVGEGDQVDRREPAIAIADLNRSNASEVAAGEARADSVESDPEPRRHSRAAIGRRAASETEQNLLYAGRKGQRDEL